MSMTLGIHHITAIASDPQTTYDFYTKKLGLRLVKRTVNQDQVAAYHLFFGDFTGEPGMDLTFFTFPDIHPGQRGSGAVTSINLAIPMTSISYWQNRLRQLHINHHQIGENMITCYDQDQQQLQLIGVPPAEYQQAVRQLWSDSPVPEKHAIGYFYSATLTVLRITSIEPILTTLGYQRTSHHKHLTTFKLGSSGHRATILEVSEQPTELPDNGGAGTVHHIAFQVKDAQAQMTIREKIQQLGLYPTQVIDRYYFKSVYFRTSAGILFELATPKPGFTVDESPKLLGQKLALPPFLETRRQQIELQLQPIKL